MAAADAGSGLFENLAIDDPDLFGDFLAEAGTHLDRVDTALLELEVKPHARGLVDEIFRPVHSIKSAAAFLGLNEVERLAHETETLLDLVRRGTLGVSSAVIDALFAAFDLLRALLASAASRLHEAQGDPPAAARCPIGIERVVTRLRAIASGQIAPARASARRLGEVLVSQGTITEEELEEALGEQRKPLGEILLAKGLVTPQRLEAALARQRAAAPPPVEAVKVDLHRLDELDTLAAEALEAHAMLTEPSPRLGALLCQIRRAAAALRLVPLRQTLERTARVATDAAHRAGRQVEATLLGEEIEVDRRLADPIGEMLIHLVRNAVDHGIEPPAERLAAGKAPTGRIGLCARREGDRLTLEVCDDGRGLDPERIQRVAVRLGLASPGAPLTADAASRLIFEPGLTTASEVTTLSGRGVGMDVVRRTAEGLGGSVSIESRPGTGVVIRIALPVA